MPTIVHSAGFCKVSMLPMSVKEISSIFYGRMFFELEKRLIKHWLSEYYDGGHVYELMTLS